MNHPTDPNDLADIKAKLVENLKRKLELQESLKDIENQIYAFEGSYLEDTYQHGNIIKGWDKYLGQSERGRTSLANDKRNPTKRKVKDADRLFSYSSITSPLMGETGVNENEVTNASQSSDEDETDEDAPSTSKMAKVSKSKLKNIAKRRNN